MDRLREINRWLESGEIQRAVASARSVGEDVAAGNQPGSSSAWALLLAKVAREAQQSGDNASAAALFQQAVTLSQSADRSGGADSQERANGVGDGLGERQRNMIRLAAAAALVETERPQEAIATLREMIATSIEVEDSQRRYGAKLLLSIGSRALQNNRGALAREAYQLALKLQRLSGADPEDQERDQATARLGAAWALATIGLEPVRAAEELTSFVKSYPQHADAPRATRAAAACLAQADQKEEAERMLVELLRRWPNSSAAVAVIQQHRDQPSQDVPEEIVDWLVGWSRLPEPLPLDARSLGFGLRVLSGRSHPEAWQVFAKRLAAIDATGETTAELLRDWVAAGQEAMAERLASQFIGSNASAGITPLAREAACLWAGRRGKWSMLALASESESLAEEDRTRTVTVQRLFAEGLTQTGRPAEARAWWVHLVETRGMEDFPTLLRCAETAVSVAEIEEVQSRIEAARSAAGDVPGRVVLVEALAAELAIRRARFDQARQLLEGVVRSAHAPPSLRARAQWLIGETHYLQQQFAAAIEAYRRVEGLDETAAWVPAALVQAGKSFEQLGRTREASVCYVSLMNRFADSEYASSARRRLAALSPDRSKKASPDGPQAEIPAGTESLRR